MTKPVPSSLCLINSPRHQMKLLENEGHSVNRARNSYICELNKQYKAVISAWQCELHLGVQKQLWTAKTLGHRGSDGAHLTSQFHRRQSSSTPPLPVDRGRSLAQGHSGRPYLDLGSISNLLCLSLCHYKWIKSHPRRTTSKCGSITIPGGHS